MDLLSVLPGFVTRPYAHILPPLERSKITTVDLITLDTLEIAKRAHVPPADVRRLSACIIESLHTDLGFERVQADRGTLGEDEPSSSINADAVSLDLGSATKLQPSRWNTISTMDPALDALLGGGVPTGYVTEVTGESGSGKTQFLLSLLLAVQLAKPSGLQKRAIYISTEHPLVTSRLSQLLECHPHLSTLPASQAPTLENILSINAMDLETQDHILNYQLPVAIARYDVGLVVIDSITSNYRAEHSSNNMLALSTRSSELAKLGQLLRNLAAKENIAIVLANQVSDRFEPAEGVGGDPTLRPGFPSIQSQRDSANASPMPRNRIETPGQADSSVPSSSPAVPSSPYPVQEDDRFDGSYLIGNPARDGILSLIHQERFFTGWGDGQHLETSLKTPALGFFWSTQIACRIALKKEETRTVAGWWDGAYPVSTPREQTDSQDQSVADKPPGPKPVVSSAREIHAKPTEAKIQPNDDNDPRNAPERATSPQRPPAPETTEHITRRTMKLVFAPWTAGSEETCQAGNGTAIASGKKRDEVEFEIWKGGLRTTRPEE